MRTLNHKVSSALVFAALAFAAQPVAAQLPSASTRALGMGDNYTAVARGYNAVAWNPAGLAMPDNPGFSIALLPLRGVLGLDPVTMSDLKDYEGELIPGDVKSRWLDDITAEGSQQGAAGGDITLLGLSVGPVGLQIGSQVRTVMNISPDAAEVLLYGNVGREGTPQDFDLRGSSMEAYGLTTVGVSYGHDLTPFIPSLPIGATRLAVGATLKYVMGHFVLRGECQECVLTSEPLSGSIVFPILQSDSSFEASTDAGSGIGVDLGGILELPRFTIAASIQNLLNTFEWDESNLFVRPGEVYFNEDSTSSSFDPVPVSSGSVEVQEMAEELVEDMKFKPVLALGASARLIPRLTLTGDLRTRLGDGLSVSPKTHLGVGAEYRIIPFVPLRLGLAVLSEGYQLSGGAGIEVGGFNLNVSGARRESDLGTDAIAMFGISFGAR